MSKSWQTGIALKVTMQVNEVIPKFQSAKILKMFLEIMEINYIPSYFPECREACYSLDKEEEWFACKTVYNVC